MTAVPDLPVARVLAERAWAQSLAGPLPAQAVEVLRRVGSLQAQDPRAVRLAVRARGRRLDVDGVRRAFAQPGQLVTTWLMRGTLHAVPAEDVRWLLDLLRPPRSAGRTRRLQLGLDDALLDRALPLLGSVLAAGPLTRAEVVSGLHGAGLDVGPGQAPAHLLGVAAREGVVCRGPDRDDAPTYALLDQWVPAAAPLDRSEGLARLARRYLAGHGPAGPADLAAWSGLPLREARAGLAALGSEVEEVRIAGTAAYRLPSGSDEPSDDGPAVRLVPAFDEYLLGYRGRDLALDGRYARRIQAGGGIIHPAVLLGGRIVGTWRQQRAGERLTVTVFPFGRLPGGIRPGLEAEAADIGRFLGLAGSLTVG